MYPILPHTPRLTVPDGLAQACDQVPGFGVSMRLLKLARWWNVWIGGSVALVSLPILMLAFLTPPDGASRLKQGLMIAVASSLFLGGAVVWRTGRTLARVVRDQPVRLRGRLALAAGGNALLTLPLFLSMIAIIAAEFGGAGGPPPAFPWYGWGVTFAALASPAVGVFANGYAWLRLGSAYDNAVVGYVPADADTGA